MKVKIWIATDRVGSKMSRTVEFDNSDWGEWTNMGKAEAVWEAIQDKMMLDWGWEEVDE